MYITIEFKINSKDLIECIRIGIHRASVTRERDLNHLNYVIEREHRSKNEKNNEKLCKVRKIRGHLIIFLFTLRLNSRV